MPRLCAATTGICPMKARASSENTNTVTRQRPTTRSWRATVMPAVSSRQRLACAGAWGTAGQGHHQQRPHDEQIGRRVAGEDPGRPDQRVEHAADDRADDPRRVHLGRVERDRARQVLPADEPRQDGRVGGPEHRAPGADPEHHHHQQDVRRMGGRARRAPPRARTPAARATGGSGSACGRPCRPAARPTSAGPASGPSWAKMMTPTNVLECVRS